MKKILFVAMLTLMTLSCTGVKEDINSVTSDDNNKEVEEQKEEKEKEGEEDTPGGQEEPTPLADSLLSVSGYPDIDMNPVIYAPSEGGEITADIETNIPDADYLIQDCSWATVMDNGKSDMHVDTFTLLRGFQLSANSDVLPRFASVLIVDTRHNPAIVLKRLVIMQCGTKKNVEFEDQAVKTALVHSKIDIDNDGEISFEEAAVSYNRAMSVGGGFGEGGGLSFSFDEDGIMLMGFSPLAGSEIKKFPELKYFGGLCHVVQLFMNCNNLETVTLPDFCTTIPSYAFKGCSSLKTITIPGSVASIANYAFAKSGLTGEIHVPSGCVVDETAFEGCSINLVRY